MSNDVPFDQLKKLWTLNLIVRSGSLKKAAAQSKVSPSAVSQTLGSLERAIGKPLIIRNRGSAKPTPTCEKLLESVAPAFSLLEKLGNPSEDVVPKLAYLNIGTYESLAVNLFPKFLSLVQEENPQAKLSVFSARTANLLTMVRKGELCVALVVDNDNLGKFFQKVLYQDRLGVYVSAHHPIKEKGWQSVEEGQIGLLRAASDGIPLYLSRFLKQFGKGFKPIFTSDSLETLRETAVQGHLAVVLPEKVAQRRPGELIEITPKGGLKNDGSHKITLISQANCDIHETNYIAEVLENCITSH